MSATAPRPRSCVTCRARKVRCDKASPCANCRRAGVDCVIPPPDNRPPRWARRLERVAHSARAAETAGNMETAPPNTTTTTTTNADLAAGGGVAQAMERLRSLESLVKELSGQLEQARAIAAATATATAAAVAAATSVSGGAGSPPSEMNVTGSATRSGDCGDDDDDGDGPYHVDASPAANMSNVQRQFGRLVLGDASRTHYVSGGFWSRVNDELEGLKMDAEGLAGGDEYDSSEDEDEDEDTPGKTPSTAHELDRTPAERYAFLFGHGLGTPAPDIRAFHPLPSQIPFLLDVFSENVNIVAQVVHMPTVRKMMRDLRSGDQSALTPANEALMFAIYYAAITSMEEDDIETNFGPSGPSLHLQYRLGLEHALARADFLSAAPDLALVQALAAFLLLARRRAGSARFVWMLTGLLVRMAQALGLHRDGARFAALLAPFEVELRRRVWWVVCMLDVRSAEDQGADFAIAHGSFDTRLPLNIDDADIWPEMKKAGDAAPAPVEREGLTDMTLALLSCGMVDVTQQMMALSARGANGTPARRLIRDQSRLLGAVFDRLERQYLRYVDASKSSSNIVYWVIVTVTRLHAAKMTLITYLPVLFSPTPSSSPAPTSSVHEEQEQEQEQEHFGAEMGAKLFVAALEVAEYNHALNAERACRHWRWIFQTYTHWYAIVYLLLAVSRRPWSPASERAWVALHSVWLIPRANADHSSSSGDENKKKSPPPQQQRIWVPLRQLWAKARRHRDAELARLRGDSGAAAARLEAEDRQNTLQPASPAPFPGVGDGESAAEFFRERWRRLVVAPTPLLSRQEEQGAGNTNQTATATATTSLAAAYHGTNARNISTSMSPPPPPPGFFGPGPMHGGGSGGPPFPSPPPQAGTRSAYSNHHHQRQQQPQSQLQPQHQPQSQAGQASSACGAGTGGEGGEGTVLFSSTTNTTNTTSNNNSTNWPPWSLHARSLNPSFGAWLWADAEADPSDPLSSSADIFSSHMDVEAAATAAADPGSSGGGDSCGGMNFGGDGSSGSEEIDWSSWVESARGMEWSG
ncbi:hypothetical protein SLS62_008076 [Diatrype stigma]|uniref:Zn(2)-C6 fungal-type domain-containing protein n=1 Tax=Diatrype stigma TaxID=117547 RepID=A0AAN9UNN5_9PEZI